MEAGHRIGRMVDQMEHRQEQFHRRRIGQRLSSFGAGHNLLSPLEPGDQPFGSEIGAYQHPDPLARIGPRERRGPAGGVAQQRVAGRLFLRRLWSRAQPHPARERLLRLGGRMGRECRRPTRGQRIEVGERLTAGEPLEDLVDGIEHSRARAVALGEIGRHQRRGATVKERLETVDQLGLAAAPAVDCLLAIAHGVERAEAGDRVFGEAFQHPPLAEGGVLEFIEEEVLGEADAAPAGGIERAVASRLPHEPRHIIKRHDPLRRHQLVGGVGIGGEQIANRPRLLHDALQDDRASDLQQSCKRGAEARIDRLVVVGGDAGEHFGGNPLGDKFLPAGGGECSQPLVPRFGNPGVGDGGGENCVHRGGDIGRGGNTGHGEPVPGGGLGVAADAGEIGDDILQGPLQPGRGGAPGELHHERRHQGSRSRSG